MSTLRSNGCSYYWVIFTLYAIICQATFDDSMTATQKMAVLRKCLEPNVQDALGDCLNDPALYEEALVELATSFGHFHLISRVYLRTILGLPKVSHLNDSSPEFFKRIAWSCSVVKKWRLRSQTYNRMSTRTRPRQASWRNTKQVGEEDSQKLPRMLDSSRVRTVASHDCKSRNGSKALKAYTTATEHETGP